MSVRLLTSSEDLAAYDQWVKQHPNGSLWQSLEWKKYQEALGREVRIYADDSWTASAVVIIDRTTGGFSTWDIPRGPLVDTSYKLQVTGSLLERIIHDAKKDHSLSLFLSPSSSLSLETCNLKPVTSSRHEQPEATRIIYLTQSEEAILAQMHQKGRYNIKVAEKHGVCVEKSKDINAFYALMKGTGGRDGFRILSKAHYESFLANIEGSYLLIATHEKKPIAGLIGIIWNGTGYYYYGASDYEHRALMAPYVLQWEAMKLCKNKGCTKYDLLGIAPPDSGPEHYWSGISSFKEKFGGTVITYPPEQEIVLKPVMRGVLKIKRKIFG